jgi:exodeoxyribonuclease VII large subunit
VPQEGIRDIPEGVLNMSILSVSEFNRIVASSLERSFPSMQIRGEIAQLTRASSGHWYFTLRDAQASVRAVMFKGRTSQLDWQPKEGDQVEVRAVVGLYEPRGDFQIRVESMTRSGQGALYEAFLARRAKLERAGLMDVSRKRGLPERIDCVGLVTSLGAAALRDVVATLSQQAPRIRIKLFPSLVQGQDAPVMLVDQLQRADRDPECDVLLLVRGGGSLEDLWAFNDEALAHAIVDCRHTVIAGVGHESDVSIADLVADIRAATPTAAAQLVAARDGVLQQQLDGLADSLQHRMSRRWQRAQQKLDLLAQSLRSPRERLKLQILRWQTWRARLDSATIRRWQTAESALSRLEAQLNALDPTAILQRGYAMVLDAHGAVVTDAAAARTDDALEVHLAKGHLEVRVHAVFPRPPTS